MPISGIGFRGQVAQECRKFALRERVGSSNLPGPTILILKYLYLKYLTASILRAFDRIFALKTLDAAAGQPVSNRLCISFLLMRQKD